MPSRLAVTLCQQTQRSGGKTDLEDQLIADILFTQGLDASIIQSLDRIPNDSTDHLCLQGIMGDMALLTWCSDEEVIPHLLRLHVDGLLVVTPFQGSPKQQVIRSTQGNPLHQNRRFHHFDLREWPSASDVLGRLKNILSNMEIRVVPLQLGGKSVSLSRITPTSSPPQADVYSSANNPSPNTLSSSSNSSVGSLTVTSNEEVRVDSSTKESHPASDVNEEEWSHLDRLVDDLDASSI